VDVRNGVVLIGNRLREGGRERERCGREEGTGMIGQCVDFSYRWGEVEDVRCF
jgi:hypothetical protein